MIENMDAALTWARETVASRLCCAMPCPAVRTDPLELAEATDLLHRGCPLVAAVMLGDEL